MPSQKERETLLELKAGNLVAFEKILYAYENQILNYIYRFVSRREDAEDLAQETFLRFYINIQKIDPDDNFKGWLYKIATNIVFDWLRKEKRTRKKFLPVGIDNEKLLEAPAIEEYRADTIEEVQNNDEVKRALRQIHPMHQSILVLFYWDGFSQPEIARLWNIPLGTVKTRIRQAKREVKKVLLESNNGGDGIKKEYGLSFSKN